MPDESLIIDWYLRTYKENMMEYIVSLDINDAKFLLDGRGIGVMAVTIGYIISMESYLSGYYQGYYPRGITLGV
jgi:hypothetical protein